MKKIFYVLLVSCIGFTIIISCSKKDSSSSSSAEDISISSSASDNASVAFGQSYQYQLTTSGTYSGTITYSLSNQPENMTISSSGLVEWTPTKASQKLQRITTHFQILQLLILIILHTHNSKRFGSCSA